MDVRAQSGMDRLALFVLAAILIVFVTPFVLGFAGIDVRAPAESGDGVTDDPPKLVVLGADGTAIDADRQSVGEVRLVVTREHTGQSVDLSAVTVSWADGGAYTLVPTDGAAAAADGDFDVSLVREGRRGTVLSKSADRGVLRFDLGTDDVDGVREFGDRLRAGQTVTIRLTTADDRTTTTNLTVPDPLPDGDPVDL